MGEAEQILVVAAQAATDHVRHHGDVERRLGHLMQRQLYLGGGRSGLLVLRLVTLAVISWGVFSRVQVVWDAADASMAVMASINLVAIVLLSGVVVKLTRDYDSQLRAGRTPEFDAGRFPEFGAGVDAAIWRPRRRRD